MDPLKQCRDSVKVFGVWSFFHQVADGRTVRATLYCLLRMLSERQRGRDENISGRQQRRYCALPRHQLLRSWTNQIFGLPGEIQDVSVGE